MNDILFEQNYVVEGDMIALMLYFIVNALLRSTYTVKKENLKLFRLASRLVGIAAVSSITYHTLIDYLSESTVGAYKGNPDSWNVRVHYAGNKLRGSDCLQFHAPELRRRPVYRGYDGFELCKRSINVAGTWNIQRCTAGTRI